MRNAPDIVDSEENQRWEFRACAFLMSRDQSRGMRHFVRGERERAHERGGVSTG